MIEILIKFEFVCYAEICVAFLEKLYSMKLTFRRIINRRYIFSVNFINSSYKETKLVLFFLTPCTTNALFCMSHGSPFPISSNTFHLSRYRKRKKRTNNRDCT